MTAGEVLKEHGKLGLIFAIIPVASMISIFFKFSFVNSKIFQNIYMFPGGLLSFFFPDEFMQFLIFVLPIYTVYAMVYYFFTGLLLSMLREERYRILSGVFILLSLVLTVYGWLALIESPELFTIFKDIFTS